MQHQQPPIGHGAIRASRIMALVLLLACAGLVIAAKLL
jgi:hypothetical protein